MYIRRTVVSNMLTQGLSSHLAMYTSNVYFKGGTHKCEKYKLKNVIRVVS
jgi:hypothetical protein